MMTAKSATCPRPMINVWHPESMKDLYYRAMGNGENLSLGGSGVDVFLQTGDASDVSASRGNELLPYTNRMSGWTRQR